MSSGRKFSYDFKYDDEKKNIFMNHFLRYLRISTTMKRRLIG